jgi:hypothetical protein
MKKDYQQPQAEIFMFDAKDIITVSGVVTGQLDDVNYSGSISWRDDWKIQQ